MKRKIYVASSWRNQIYPRVVEVLRDEGHQIYDFRNPAPGCGGFAWSQIDAEWASWSPAEYAMQLLTHPRAAEGFRLDKAALDWADTCVLVLPCGRSAHLEAGYAAGKNKQTFVLLSETGFEPELMYLLCSKIVCEVDDLIIALKTSRAKGSFATLEEAELARERAHAAISRS